MRWISSLALVLLATTVVAEESWNREAAARYLDARADMWVTRSRARQKLTTACISCHTAMPYLLSRASLGGSPSSLPQPAQDLFRDVEARVMHWGDVKVWYDTSRGEEKPVQSWGTESVINAFVLTMRDRRSGGPLTEEAKTALRHMWARQTDEGNWPWLHFDLGPWEADGSDYWGASLAAVAGMSAGRAARPSGEASAKLRSYLRLGLSGLGLSGDLNLHNRVALLWAASAWDGLLSTTEKRRLVDEVLQHQQPDGGFRLVDLGTWPSEDKTPPNDSSDGYATAFTTFVLQRLDDPRAAEAIRHGVAWLEHNQKADGRWETLSPNKDRSNEEAFTRLLASDAATGFAVLALTSTTDETRPTEP